MCCATRELVAAGTHLLLLRLEGSCQLTLALAVFRCALF